MTLNQSLENKARWESQPIRSVFWGGRKYDVEVNAEYPGGTYGFDFFEPESTRCKRYYFDPKSDRILIENTRLSYVPVVQNAFPPQLESKLKDEVRHQIFLWKTYLKAKRKIIRAELKQVYELMSVSSSLEEDRLLADEGLRLESELSEVS